MYDWKAKITRLLELPELTDEQKGGFDEHLAWIELDTVLQEIEGIDVRFDEQLIRLDLERLIEARSGRWTVGLSNDGDYMAEFFPLNLSVFFARGATPAQAIMDALLSAVGEAQP